MLVFNLTTGGKLPNVASWIQPRYYGPGDLYASRSTGAVRDDPEEWEKSTGLSSWNYTLPRFVELKESLNVVKKRLDLLHANMHKAKRYETVSHLLRPLSNLHGTSGVLVQQYNAEIVTNAWLKMYEMCAFLEPILLRVLRSRTKQFTSVHFAEAPGNFMLAINHYIATLAARENSNIDWQWMANSYRDLFDTARFYLDDHHGMMAKYPTRWFWGCEGNGDITLPDNIRSFDREIRENIGLLSSSPSINLVTSDVKYAPRDMDFAEEERINLPVHMGQLLCCLRTLTKGGTMIIKDLTFYEPMSVSLVYLITTCFEKVQITKPETSRPFNSEVYVVASGYKQNIDASQFAQLDHCLRFIRGMSDGRNVPALFRRIDIPSGFLDELYTICAQLHKLQTTALEDNIHNFEQYKNADYETITSAFEKSKTAATHDWIHHTQIAPLPPAARLL